MWPNPLDAARFPAYLRGMSTDPNLLGPNDIAYHLELTPVQLKVTQTALKTLFDGLGHEEHVVRDVVRSVLDKLPDEHEVRSIAI